MLLGIVLHSAQSYTPEGALRIHESASLPIFRYIVDFIHAFRLPAFFFIAGLVMMGALRRRGPLAFAKRRLLRIGLPLLSTLLTLNVVQFVVSENIASDAFHQKSVAFIARALLHAVVNGSLLLHLWFLCTLSIFSIGAILLTIAYNSELSLGQAHWKKLCHLVHSPAVFFGVIPVLSILLMHASWRLERGASVAGIAFLGPLSAIGSYLPFFFVGAVLGAAPHTLHRITDNISWFVWCSSAMAITLVASVALHGVFSQLAQQASTFFAGWLGTAVSLFIGRRIFSRLRFDVTPFVEFSFIGYLFHYLPVLLFSFALTGVHINPLAKSTIVLMLATVACISVFLLLQRVPWIYMCFIGRTPAEQVSLFDHSQAPATAMLEQPRLKEKYMTNSSSR